LTASPPRPEPRRLASVPVGGSGFGTLVGAATRLKSAPVGERHAALLREALRLERARRVGRLALGAAEELLGRIGREMGKPEAEIAGIITWARAQSEAAKAP
jgi:hypothetical protein